MKTIKLDNIEVEIHNDHMDNDDIFDFEIHKPSRQILTVLNHYNQNTLPLIVDIGGIRNKGLMTLCAGFSLSDGTGYNVRIKAFDNV